MISIVAWDGLRTIALLMGGVTFGLAIAEAHLYYRRKRTPGDPWYGRRRLDYMVGVRVGTALLTACCVAVVATKLGDDGITFRTPLAVVSFAALIWGMSGILADDEALLDDPAFSNNRGRRETDNIG